MNLLSLSKVFVLSSLLALLFVLPGSTSSKSTVAQARSVTGQFQQPDYDKCLFNYECYSDTLVAELQGAGIRPALSSLETLSEANSAVRNYCHALAHELGRQAFESNSRDIGVIFDQGDTTCWSGFYHGALEQAFSYSDDLVKTGQSLCTEENGVQGSFLYYQCLHGLGHGLSVRFANEIYDALGICEQLNDPYQQSSCYGGVFMENYVANPDTGHFPKYLDKNDPIAPCNKVAEKFKYNCYQLVSIQILKLNGYDFGKAFKTCESSDQGYVKVCYQSVGRDASGFTAEDPDKALGYCYLGNHEAQKECVRAVAADSVYSKSSENYVVETCKKVRTELKNDCYESAGNSISILYESLDRRSEACEKMETAFIGACKSSAGV